MGKIKGQKEFLAWKAGKPLTRKQALLAQCYTCNGEEEGAEDCKGSENCPLYAFFPYKGRKRRLEGRLSLPEAESGSFKGDRNAPGSPAILISANSQDKE